MFLFFLLFILFSFISFYFFFFFFFFFYYQFTGSEKYSSVTESVNTKQNPLPLHFFYNKNPCFSFSIKMFEQNSKKYSLYLTKHLSQKNFCCNKCDTNRSHVSDSYLVFHVFFIKKKILYTQSDIILLICVV